MHQRLPLLAIALACAACAEPPQRAGGTLEYRVQAAAVLERGLKPLSGADGFTTLVTRGGARCLANQPGTNPPSSYLYFDIEDSAARQMRRPVYVLVEYLDDAPFGGISLHYDSTRGDALNARYADADDAIGNVMAGTRSWRTAAFKLSDPLFHNRQNLGADFRLYGLRLHVRAVRLSSERPSNWDELGRVQMRSLQTLVKIGPGGELIIGGFDPAVPEDAVRQTRALEAAVPSLKALGVTSHETYIRWNLCEPEPGKWDWSVYDRYVEVYKKTGLKWVPFLICGSAYSLPRWFYKQPGSQGYVCLEHNQESDVQSLWNPEMRRHVARFIQAFCERYRDSGVIESILLGVTGNYGEAIYVATGNDWTADVYGPYHTHEGYWAGDKFAVASFRAWLARKYGGSGPLRDAWGEKAPTLENARPMLKRDAPNERAWLDMCDWYIGSMTEFSRFWLTETRKHFPKGSINLCTGGHAPSEHGADFGDQCKAAAEVGGGVRITNEGSDMRANFSLTRWVASAGKQYGAYYSFEPAGEVNAQGVIARIYNATASGARGLHYYMPNLFGSEEAHANFVKWGGQFRQRKPVVEIAVYYPQTHIKLNTNDFLELVQPLRDRFDFDYQSDQQILDGGLGRYKALILVHGSVSEPQVWSAVSEWIKKGGLVLYPEGMGRLRTPEGDASWHDRVLGPGNRGRGRVLTFSGQGRRPEYRAWLVQQLREAPELGAGTRAMLREDGEEDNVFATLCEPSELLWLNYQEKPTAKGGRQLPPWSIVSTTAR